MRDTLSLPSIRLCVAITAMKWLFLPFLSGGFILAALFPSCRTYIPVLPWTEHEVSEIIIKVRPASRESLEAEFGRPPFAVNPLLDYPSVLQQRRLVVFDISIESPQVEVEVVTEETTLIFVNPDAKMPTLFDPETRALDAEGLEREWTIYYDPDRRSDLPTLVNRTRDALPGNLIARPGEPAEGYLVFLRRFPKSGTAQLSLALRTPEGDSGTVNMDIVIPDTRKKNTGIFAGGKSPEEAQDDEARGNTGIFSDE